MWNIDQPTSQRRKPSQGLAVFKFYRELKYRNDISAHFSGERRDENDGLLVNSSTEWRMKRNIKTKVAC